MRPTDPQSPEPYRNHRMAHYMTDLAARLRAVCAHLSEEEFAALVYDIAVMRQRLEVLDDLPGGQTPIRD